ncbi:hypothetical protein [Celeribacter halophilus]|uniref:hypothetical protein n=1 Tax=Celeribacter halophilus TaxID=576117 RepID=UPI001C0942EF|nr:hypothetical protein [Celeribacter halophilus]MBU2889526.1 hypothetical protein [Celeribacter halophilus]MDO6512360.1 hypothetical protein [Celeribacter halophilus]
MTFQIHRTPEELAAMQRSRDAARQLDVDARDVANWLDAQFPGMLVFLEVQRHYSCEDYDIAHVEPRVTDRPRRHEVREAAELALKSLGWKLNPEGRDVRSEFYRPLASAHARLAATARVIKALKTAETLDDAPTPTGENDN